MIGEDRDGIPFLLLRCEKAVGDCLQKTEQKLPKMLTICEIVV